MKRWIFLVIRIAIGGLFILAGLSKVTQPMAEFVGLVRQWNILPDPFTTWFAYTLPWAELIFGVFLLIGLWQRFSSVMIGLMLLSFIIAISINLGRGLTLEDCGCFGGWFHFGTSMLDLLIRDTVMIGMLVGLWFDKDHWLSMDGLDKLKT